MKQSKCTLAIILLLGYCSVLFSEGAGEETTLDEGLLLHVPSPDWQDQIIYMIMTDRFWDGNPANNDFGHGEFLKGSPHLFNGGDIQGITEKVDYLKELGATALWITPPVYNQWISSPYESAGWHGYWAVDFSQMDPHFGTLDDYKVLSHTLHSEGMYLIQDIVCNHVGNFYAYDDPYDPGDTAKGFRLLEADNFQPAPVQFPFNLIDRLNPEHARADIYHWTPTIEDYNDKYQETHYMLGYLSDINTENPLVIETFKKTYQDWILKVGVDGFRIDTVMLVDRPFWEQFLNDPNGIHPYAKSIGKADFLTFGESTRVSDPFEQSGEEKVAYYLGTDEKPALKSMLGYPLYSSMTRVFAEGKPTAELAFRLKTGMEAYPNPFIIPNFVDNHDTKRFLSSGRVEGFQQALITLFTIPGIPILLQGTEQALLETRQSMFEGGWGTENDQFNRESDPFKFVRSLCRLRRENPVLTRGSLCTLAANDSGPGLLAYKREYEGETVLVLLNTANHSIWMQDLDTGLPANRQLSAMFLHRFEGEVRTDGEGEVSLQLPANSALVLTTKGAVAASVNNGNPETVKISLEGGIGSGPLTTDTLLQGTINLSSAKLLLVVDGNLDKALEFESDTQGDWEVTLPVRDLGAESHSLSIYAPGLSTSSASYPFMTQVNRAEVVSEVQDFEEDDTGPEGTYLPPTGLPNSGQKDILSVAARAAGANLELTLTMRALTNAWDPRNGFDNVAFSIFFDLPDRMGAFDLPLLNARMPLGADWDLGHVAGGWGNFSFTAEGAGPDRRGTNTGVAPRITADAALRKITIHYPGNLLGVDSWLEARIYVTTWDINGEGVYLDIQPEEKAFSMGGGNPDDPKIMDDAFLTLLDTPNTGMLKRIDDFDSKHVPTRPVYVWLPEDYDPGHHYPVLYMHDGQVLFDEIYSMNLRSWEVDETVSRLIREGKIPPCIVVGIWNTSYSRHAEYFPQKPWESLPQDFRESLLAGLDSEYRSAPMSGSAFSDAYLKYIVKELKPYVDSQYAAAGDVSNTLVMGSSMGGLISMYAICEYPDVFGAAACLSTHWIGKFDDEDNPIPAAFYVYLKENLPDPDWHRVYFDYGTETLDVYYEPHQKKVDSIMEARGFGPENWITRRFEGEDHSESAWARRLHIPLEFLFSTTSTSSTDD